MHSGSPGRYVAEFMCTSYQPPAWNELMSQAIVILRSPADGQEVNSRNADELFRSSGVGWLTLFRTTIRRWRRISP